MPSPLLCGSFAARRCAGTRLGYRWIPNGTLGAAPHPGARPESQKGKMHMFGRKRLPEDTSRGERTTLAPRKKATPPATRRALARVEPAALERADRIVIEGLEVFANHGVYAAETELGQKFTVSATLYADLHRAGETDDLASSIDYGAVCHEIDAFMRGHTYKLIEAAAEHLAHHLLESYPQLIGVRVRVAKPWAPIGLPLTSVAVEIERTR